MPRRTAITAGPTSPTAKRRTLHASPTASAPPATAPVTSTSRTEPVPVIQHGADVNVAPTKAKAVASPVVATKKIIRLPKYHETSRFLSRESAVPSDVPVPYHLGQRASECYRVVATIHRAVVEQATMHVQPISWGYGWTDGSLGHNNTAKCVDVLKKVGLFRHSYLRQVAAGDKLSLFLTSDGRVLQSGRLYLHQDGHKMWKPREVEFSVNKMEKEGGGEGPEEAGPPIVIKSIEAGHLAAYAIDDQGRLFSWGTRRYGQLGHGDDDEDNQDQEAVTTPVEDEEENSEEDDDDEEKEKEEDTDVDPSMPFKHLSRTDPVEASPRVIDCPSLRGVLIRQLSAGNHFVLALSDCGRVFSWGRNTHAQLGLAEPSATITTPHLVDGLGDYIVLDVAAGHSHSLAVAIPRMAQPASFAGYSLVFAWGSGQRGRLGIGEEAAQSQPVEVTFFRGLYATQVAAGHDHSLVLCATGSTNVVYAFGGNAFGQLGVARDTVTFSDMPLCVEELDGLTIAAIGAGAYTSAVLSGDGEVYAWGDGSRGKTARPDKRTTFVPWKVAASQRSRFALQDTGFVTQLAMGAHHTLALYRTEGVPDRWRKFPLGEVVHAVSEAEREDNSINFQSLCCPSTHACATNGVFGIQLHCEHCNLGPLCRVCTRRCHRGHRLVPRLLSDTLRLGAIDKQQQIACACGARRPPPPPRKGPTRAVPTNLPVPAAIVLDNGDKHCKMAKAPDTVQEDSVLW